MTSFEAKTLKLLKDSGDILLVSKFGQEVVLSSKTAHDLVRYLKMNLMVDREYEIKPEKQDKPTIGRAF